MGGAEELEGQDGLGLSREERLALVERVAGGRPLQRSARLRELLLYVGRQSLFDGGAQLRESDIGTVVFGRNAQYDTSQDNIVRVNFTELRKRIQQYFHEDGADEPVIFTVPRGTYGVHFQRRQSDAFDRLVESQPSAEPQAAVPAPETEIGTEGTAGAATVPVQPARSYGVAALAAFACLCLMAAVFFYLRTRELSRELNAWSATPGMQAFWAPLFGAREPVDLVLADSSVALAQDMTLRQLSLSDYINNAAQSLLNSAGGPGSDKAQAERDLELILGRNTGSIGDFRVAAEIHDLAPRRASRLFFAREYSPALVRQHNSVLLGSRKSNPWVELFEGSLEYRISTSNDRRETFVTVVHPRGSEPAQYASFSDTSTPTGYCIVAMLPNPGGTGSTLLIAGTDAQATEAGGDFLTNERFVEELIRQAGSSRLGHLQFLLRTERVRGTPMSAHIVSLRTGS